MEYVNSWPDGDCGRLPNVNERAMSKRTAKASGDATSVGRLRGSALDDDLAFLLARATALTLAAGNAAMREFGLKTRSFAVLELAAAEVQPSQRDIAEYLRLDPSQVVALVDELESAKLVTRKTDPVDRRANVVVATPAGSALCERARRAARATEERLHSQLTADERAQITHTLRRIAFPA